MQKSAPVTIITLAITLSLLACSDRSVGVENNNNQNTNQAQYLNRHILFHGTASSLMGFATDANQSQECICPYEDVNNDPDYLINHYLCNAINILDEVGVDTASSEPGKFLPYELVFRHEMWSVVTEGVQFLPYTAQCSRIIAETEHQPFLGALCEKGLLAEFEPFENVPISEWSNFTVNFGLFLEQDTNRVYAMEVLLTAFVLEPDYAEVAECTPYFSDVEPDSFRCNISNLAYDFELSDGYQDGTFRPDNFINGAEFAKALVLASNLPQDEPSGCYPCDGEWYCSYVDTLCTLDLLPEDFTPAGSIPLREALHMIYEIMLILN